METITVVATRSFALSDTEIILAGAVIIAAVAWMVLSGVRHFRTRQAPRI